MNTALHRTSDKRTGQGGGGGGGSIFKWPNAKIRRHFHFILPPSTCYTPLTPFLTSCPTPWYMLYSCENDKRCPLSLLSLILLIPVLKSVSDALMPPKFRREHLYSLEGILCYRWWGWRWWSRGRRRTGSFFQVCNFLLHQFVLLLQFFDAHFATCQLLIGNT